MTQQQIAFLVIAAIIVVALIIKSNESSGSKRAPAAANLMDPRAWDIGPSNYPTGNPSVGMPAHPLEHRDGWCIDIPGPTADDGHVHYLRVPTGPLAGKKKITMRFRIEADPAVKLVPTKIPNAPALLTLFLQRAGDEYTRSFEAYRWWASFATMRDPRASEYALEAPLDENWTAVLTSSRNNNPAGFQAALDDTEFAGFTLGGGDGLGHGVYATGSCRLVVTSFEVA